MRLTLYVRNESLLYYSDLNIKGKIIPIQAVKALRVARG
jgi:hypothetical protein